MSRNTGTFNFAANFEVLAKAPLDAKQLVGTKADLTLPSTWNASGSLWLYNGAMVSVGSDPIQSNNGIYWLCDATNYTQASSWVKAGSGSITGATNGLHITGSSVALGGTLGENTTINANSKNFCIYNANSITISSTGLGQATSVNGYNTQFVGSNSLSITTPQFSAEFSTRGNICDTSAQPRGLVYMGNYRSTFLCNSLVDAAYVTGKTNTVNVYRQTSTGSYTANTSSDFIGAWANSTIYLPNPAKDCQRITVTDVSGLALGDMITICGNGMNINDGPTATINTDYGSVTLVNNGIFWSTVGFIN